MVKITNGVGALWIKQLLPEEAIKTMNKSKFEVAPKQFAKEDYFLFIIHAVDANFYKDSPQVVVDETELITQGDQLGVITGGWEILFDKHGGTEISVVNVQR